MQQFVLRVRSAVNPRQPDALNQWYPRILWVDNNFLHSFFHIMGCLQYHWQTNPYQIFHFSPAATQGMQMLEAMPVESSDKALTL